MKKRIKTIKDNQKNGKTKRKTEKKGEEQHKKKKQRKMGKKTKNGKWSFFFLRNKNTIFYKIITVTALLFLN